jgi:hypothetical protein
VKRIDTRAVLVRHPDSRSDAVTGIQVQVDRVDGATLAVSYELRGDPNRLRIPAPQPPRIADRLWEHTCFEIFIGRNGATAYHELNFSPSGEWAAYGFERYRQGTPLVDRTLDPRVRVRTAADKLELDAVVRLDPLSTLYAGARLSIGLSAVTEESDGRLAYWALAHAPGKPDFHQPGAFALEL